MNNLLPSVLIVQKLMQEIIDSDSGSDDEENDDEMDQLAISTLSAKRRKVCIRNDGFIEHIIPNYLPLEFRQHFRLSRPTFDKVVTMLRPHIVNIHGYGRPRIDAEKQLLSVLWLLATPESFRSVGDRFDMSKGSLENCFQSVIKALEILSSDVVVWPAGTAKNEVVNGFQKSAGFPSVIGAIDGTHIKIKAPTSHADDYRTRKKVHAISLQAVCDHRLKLIDCFAGFPGSVHDARVLRNSPLHHDAQSDVRRLFPDNTHLIGDAAYPLKKWLMVPFKDNGHLSRRQRQYNIKLSKTRSVVERSFALLKGRFRRLKDTLDMNRTDLIATCIIACCVLHNLCLEDDDDIEDMIDNAATPSNCTEVTDSNDIRGSHVVAVAKRDAIVNSL